MNSRRSCRSCAGPRRYGVLVGGGGVVGGGGNVGTGVVRAGVGGGVLTTGADVCGGGVALAGALVAGAIVMLGSGENDADDDAEAEGDAEPELAGATLPRAKKSRKITTTVARLPATAARPRSTQRGPRRGVGGGMILVVSVPMPDARASAMPRAERAHHAADAGTA